MKPSHILSKRRDHFGGSSRGHITRSQPSQSGGHRVWAADHRHTCPEERPSPETPQSGHFCQGGTIFFGGSTVADTFIQIYILWREARHVIRGGTSVLEAPQSGDRSTHHFCPRGGVSQPNTTSFCSTHRVQGKSSISRGGTVVSEAPQSGDITSFYGQRKGHAQTNTRLQLGAAKDHISNVIRWWSRLRQSLSSSQL